MKALTLNSLLGIVLLLVGVFFLFFGSLFFSVPLLVAGLVLLLVKRSGSENAEAEEKPVGVIIVAVLTLFASFGLVFLSLVLFFLNFVGGAFASAGAGPWIDLQNMYVLFPPLFALLFALFSFIASILMLAGVRSKHMWYAMVVFWILLFAFCSWWGYTFVWYSLGAMFLPVAQIYPYMIVAMLVPLIPLAYCLSCLLYFQKLKVKKYFHVK